MANKKHFMTVNLKFILISYFIVAGGIPLILWCVYNKYDWIEWYTMLFSYLGGGIGGLATLIAIVITTQQNNKIQMEERRKEIEPMVSFDCKSVVWLNFKKSVNRLNLYRNSNLDLKIFNLSNYPAKDLKVKFVIVTDEFIKLSNSNGIKLDYQIGNNKALKISRDNNSANNDIFGLVNILYEELYVHKETRRFLFRNEDIYLKFDVESIIYKSFLEDLIFEYINKSINQFKCGLYFTKKEIAKVNINVSYTDIKDLKTYNNDYILSIGVDSINVIKDEEIINQTEEGNGFMVLFYFNITEANSKK